MTLQPRVSVNKIVHLGLTEGNFCKMGFNEAYNYEIIDIRFFLLYELTCRKVSLRYEFKFFIILHIK